MRPEDIRAKARGNFGEKIFSYETVDSTNTLALNMSEDMPEGTVVVSEIQRKGKGRLGREWLSPSGNIYFSLLLKPSFDPSAAALLTLTASVACAIALKNCTGLDIRIKWPNDLMCSGKKLGGILTELKTAGGRIEAVVVGIGINANDDLSSFPLEIRETATSLLKETGHAVSREEIVALVLDEFERWYTILREGERESILSVWRHLTSTLGREVRVKSGNEIHAGFAEAIDEEGRLLLRLSSGEILKINSGDVTVLR